MRRCIFLFGALLLIMGMVITGCSNNTAQPSQPSAITSAVSTQVPSQTTAQASPVASTAKIIKIGVMAPLTGPSSTAGIPHWRMTQITAEWINSQGGITIQGEKYNIELIVEDEKDIPDTGVAAATKLVESDKVQFMVGTINPPIAAAVAPVTESARVIRSLWHGEGATIVINADTKYTFCMTASPQDVCYPLLKYHTEAYPNAKKILFLLVDSPAGELLYQNAQQMIGSMGLTSSGANMYPVDTQDFYPVITGALNAQPDAIVCTALPHLMGGILKTARELGFMGPIYNLSPTSPEVVQHIAGVSLATDCIVPAPFVLSDQMTPVIKEMAQKAIEKYNEVNFDYIRPVDSLWSLVQAIQKAQSLDTTVVAQTWETMDNIQTLSGTAKMGGQQTYGINHIGILPIAITRINGEKLEHIRWATMDIP
ncbi:MAG: ABC transporter substrate-binding protein [Dehalococcoidales bacterium]|nr:ABC transporter substrate-binding protein [Dehalococcoidales bacterium]